MELEVSVVIPVYKNTSTIYELYERITLIMNKKTGHYEILFVDDDCPEGSLTLLRELAVNDHQVAVLVMSQNVGQHRAVLSGLRFSRGKRVVVLDADLQDPPEAVPLLLAKMDEGFDAVFAGRRGRYECPLRLFTSRLFKELLHSLCGVPSDAGMFVAMSRQMVDRLLAMNESRPFVVAMIGCTGLPLTSIPVTRSCRPDGRSAYSSWKRLMTGCLTISKVFSWKWNRGRPFVGHYADPVPVKAYFGARFTPAMENPLRSEDLETRTSTGYT